MSAAIETKIEEWTPRPNATASVMWLGEAAPYINYDISDTFATPEDAAQFAADILACVEHLKPTPRYGLNPAVSVQRPLRKASEAPIGRTDW